MPFQTTNMKHRIMLPCMIFALVIFTIICPALIAETVEQNASPSVSGELNVKVSIDLRQPIEPINRRILGLCLMHPPFKPEVVNALKPILKDSSVRVWLHKPYTQEYIENINALIKETGVIEVFGINTLCQMPNLVARYENETDNNLFRSQQTPQFHNDIITHLNNPLAPDKSRLGLDVLEVWNEPQYPQNGAWPAEDYARYAADVSRRAREADPGIDIGLCLRPDDKWPKWNQEMLMALMKIDPTAANVVMRHPYDFFWIRSQERLGRYYAVVGGSENHRTQLKTHLNMIQRIGHGRLRLALTEWNTHPNGYAPPTFVSRDLPVAINMAAAFHMYWELGVDSAHYFLVRGEKPASDGSPDHFGILYENKDGSLGKNPTYEVMRLYGEKAHGTRMTTMTKSPHYSYVVDGKHPIENKIDLVTTMSMFDFDKNELKVMLVNRHRDNALPVTIQLKNFEPSAAEGELEILTGDSPEALNPIIRKETVAIPSDFNEMLTVTLSPHSVTALTIPGIRPLTEEERVSKLLYMIRDWKVCGVFPGPAKETTDHGLSTVIPCLTEGIDGSETFKGFDNSEARWTHLTASANGFIDFFDPHRIMGLDQKVQPHLQGLALTWLYSPTSQEVTFSLGADYWAVLKVNGTIAVDMTKNPGGQPKSDKVRGKVELVKGWNKLELRMSSGSKGMGFWVGVENPGGLTELASFSKPTNAPENALRIKAGAAVHAHKWHENQKQNYAETKDVSISANPVTERFGYVRWNLPAIDPLQLKEARIVLIANYNKDAGEIIIGPVLDAWKEKELTWINQPKRGKSFTLTQDANIGTWTYGGTSITTLVQSWLTTPDANFGIWVGATNQAGYAGFVSDENPKTPPILELVLK